jgi:DNA-binding MarR family transcriptional regulator
MVLAERSREGGLVTQQELGRGLCIDKSNVARLCAKMELAGHIRQERTPLDGRARLLSLTDSGLEVAVAVERSSLRRFRQIDGALNPRLRPGVLEALAALNGAVSASLEPIGPPARRRPRGAP